MNNVRALLLALPLTVLLAGCPIYSGEGTPIAECRSDDDCRGATYCDGTVCRDGRRCAADAECPDGFVCGADAVCREGSRCANDDACGDGFICEAGVCEPGERTCRIDGDCPVGTYCEGDACVPATGCSDDSACDEGFWCDHRGTCSPRPDEGCRSDADCGDDICIEGLCRDLNETCQFDRQCPPGQACLNARCSAICTDAAHCPAGTTCDGGYCRPNPGECTTSAECAEGSCVDGRCLEGCMSAADCPSETYCAEDGFCRPEWGTDDDCTLDSDCASGRVCRLGACRTPCPNMTNGECLAIDSQLPICALDPAVGEHLCRAANEGEPECRVQADCGTRDCVDGICRNRS